MTPINSQMYINKPKQVQKKLSENTGKTFSVIMPSFTCKGGGHIYGNYSTDRLWMTKMDRSATLHLDPDPPQQTKVQYQRQHKIMIR